MQAEVSSHQEAPGDQNGDGNWHVVFGLDGQWFLDPTPMTIETASLEIEKRKQEEPGKYWTILKENVELDNE